MSQTFVSRIKFRFIAAITLLILGSTSRAHAQQTLDLPAPIIPSSPTLYVPRNVQTFHALIDDAIVKTPSDEPAEYYSETIGCWLTGPAAPGCQPGCQCDSCETPLGPPPAEFDDDDEGEWDALLMCHCPEKSCTGNECKTSSLANSGSPCQSGCAGCPESDCPADLITNPSATDNDEFCKQVAQLLATTLENSDTTPAAKRRAIESAMKMVAKNATSVSEAKLSKLKEVHQREIASLQFQVDHASDQAASIEQIKSWLSPIYSNQNRNFEQMKLMNATQFSMNRSLMILGQMNGQAYAFSPPTPLTTRNTSEAIKHSSYVPRIDETAELARLRAQLDAVNRRIERLQPKPVQRASYLEPIYVPNRRLDPILSKPKSNEPYNYRR